MLYLVTNKPQQVWQDHYLMTYESELKARNTPYQLVPASDVDGVQLKDTDLVWIMSYKDIRDVSRYCRRFGAKTLFRLSGTAMHPWSYQVDVDDEIEDFKDIDYMLVPTESTAKAVKPITVNNVLVTGYPMRLYDADGIKLKSPAKRKNRIVIGGRLSPDKQPLLAMHLLTRQLQKGVIDEVVFCYPSEKELKWLEAYGGAKRWERLGFQFKQMTHKEWIAFAADSRFYFTASLGDTVCYSLFEAVSLGCLPLVPDTSVATLLPVMHEVVSSKMFTYPAFSERGVAESLAYLQRSVESDTFRNSSPMLKRLLNPKGYLNKAITSPDHFFDVVSTIPNFGGN